MSNNISIVNKEIKAIDDKIAKYQTAKTDLFSVKGSVTTRKSTFKRAFDKMRNNSELMKFKKTGVFEGELANSMAVKLLTFKSATTGAETRANEIERSVSSLISTIDKKISSLQSEKKLKQNHVKNLTIIKNSGGR